jgi:hypothetical protein
MKDNFPKRNQIFILTPYLFFLVAKEPFKKDDVPKKKFWEDLGLLIVKTHQVL